TTAPDSKPTSATVPGNSLLIIAPCTAETEPTAESNGGQFSCFTSALVTVVGGIPPWPPDFSLAICRPFTKTRGITTKAITATTPIAPMMNVRSQPDFVSLETEASGLMMSCINWFGFCLKQQAPKSSRYFQLTRTPFRFGHLLRLQSVSHQHSASDCKY